MRRFLEDVGRILRLEPVDGCRLSNFVGRPVRSTASLRGGLATRIALINGQRLAELMIDHDVGVSGEATYTVKRVDSDYFDE